MNSKLSAGQKKFEHLKIVEDFISNSEEVFYIHDKNGQFQYLSPSAKKYFDFSEKELNLGWKDILTDNPVNKEQIKTWQSIFSKKLDQADYELEIFDKSGKKFWVKVSESPVLNDQGEILQISGKFCKINEAGKVRQRAVEHLLDFEDLILKMDHLICEINGEGEYTYLSKNYNSILGYKPEELIEKKFYLYLHPDDRKRADEALYRFMESKSAGSEVWRFKHKKGHYISFDCNGAKYTDDQGNPKTLVLSHDISGKLEILKDLEDQKSKLEESELITKTGYWELDLLTRQMWGSKGALEIYGVDKELLDLEIIQNIPLPEYRPMLNKALKDLIQYGKEYNVKFKIRNQKTKKIIDIHSVARYKKDKNRIMGIIQDKTESVKAENEIRMAEEAQRLIVEKNAVPMIIINKEGNPELINKRFIELLGYNLEEINSLEKWMLLAYPDPEYRDKVSREWSEALVRVKETGKDGKKQIWNVKCQDGSTRTFDFHTVSVGDKSVISLIDLTEIKSIENALRESEQTFKSLFDNSRSGLVFTDLQGNILEANPTYLHITRRKSLEETIGLNIFEFKHLRKLNVKENFEKCVRDKRVVYLEFEFPSDKNELRQAEIYLSPVFRNNKISGVLINIVDSTDIIQTRKKLEENERRLRMSIQAAGHGLFETHFISREGYINDEFIRHLGYSNENFNFNLDFWIGLMHPEDIPFVDRHLHDYFTGRAERYQVEYRVKKKSGDYAWLLVRGELISRNEKGDPELMIGTLSDISEIKQYQEQIIQQNKEIAQQNEEYATLNEELQLSLEEKSAINKNLQKISEDLKKSDKKARTLLAKTRQRNSEITMLLAGSRKILETDNFKDTAKTLCNFCLGLARSELASIVLFREKKQGYERYFYSAKDEVSEDLSYFLNSAEEILTQTKESRNIILINDFHKSKWTSVPNPEEHKIKKALFAPLIVQKKVVGILCLANKKEDFSIEDKNIVGAFAELISLAFHNSRVLSNLKASKRKAEESDQLKSAFLANMSHEIRTPMNAILGFSDLLLNKDINRDKRDSFSKMIHNSSKQLLTIINDIIDISKIESNQLTIEPEWIVLDAFIEEVFLSFKQTNIYLESKSKIVYKPKTSGEILSIYGDRMRLSQVFNNLLSNACKFDPGGSIELGYDFTREDKRKFLQFYVKDLGIGINKENQLKIFNRFYQADNQQVVKGTGLGLSISKGLVQKMGGKIWVESAQNQGSTFYFTIPYREMKMNEGLEKLDSSLLSIPELNDYNIYVAEDNLPSFLYIEELLEDTGIGISHFLNGEDLVNAVMENKPDIILMDINMPVMNGLTATQILRKRNIEIPIIAQTAYAMSNEKIECLQAGCNSYISKPLNPELLLNLIVDHLKKE